MRRRDFQRLVESLESLSPHQLRQLDETVSKLAQQTAVRELVTAHVEREGQCPHCQGNAFQRWGTTASGEQRYRCKKCFKSFTGLTGSPLNGLWHKSLLLEYAQCMKVGLSVRETAEQLGLHRNVVFRWRHRLMPPNSAHQPEALEGVAEVDEAFFRESFKGLKKGMPRTAHKRAMPAGKRGISKEQIPVLTAVSRGSRTSFMSVLPGVPSASSITSSLGPLLSKDTVLVSDSASSYKTAAKNLGIVIRQIPRGTHKLGPYHIQNVNALHSRMKSWFKPFKGVATKYLPVYLAWFRFYDESGWSRVPEDLIKDAISRPRVRPNGPSETSTLE
ncbi:IS1595 family transposase [Rhodoferax sp. TBRC 17198]|uniref:IS1595 family transposase n=1 Tax=Rhodoferax potami TaxID=3068338 RepID=UPI0028BE9DC6|nr:IS1595 family transposase [Rhodoferax sp. TBRC 17198]MDT7524423.1 IS1595 family transposase [Rhodoferax sp. TBRC 17198]MDT7524435.1 IS1595 family transposase [Rhodoferax sp. TBRC 17198]